MIGFKQRKKKFSFYYLEESEIYTKYLSVNFSLINLSSNNEKYIIINIVNRNIED